MLKSSYRCIGVMTGNSLDAVDVVLTEFNDNKMQDICGHTKDIPLPLAENFRNLKTMLSMNGGDIVLLADNSTINFDKLHDDYINLIATTIRELLALHNIEPQSIDAIGLHGQTCAHCPPSIAKSKKPQDIYTLQIGSGQMLADLTGIPVVFDFRSDDLMNFGEAAPLAPVHNQHIARDLKTKEIFPVAFCNGGNTGNLAIISEDVTGKEIVIGWDTGPFNHFIDYLCRTEMNQPYDCDGQFGSQGNINFELLRQLFEKSVITQDGKNFLLQSPPKSSDPAWYKIIPALTDKNIPFANRIRTAEFFSAYLMAYNLNYIPEASKKPQYFLIFGGGWRNPIVFKDFQKILTGQAQVLPEHQTIFENIKTPKAVIKWSDEYGYNGQYMEARIFADMAKCKLTNEAFSYPSTTGCQNPTVGGIIVHPGDGNTQRWSRASKGWADK